MYVVDDTNDNLNVDDLIHVPISIFPEGNIALTQIIYCTNFLYYIT